MATLLAPLKTVVFPALWLFAIFVSVLDGFLALQNREVLQAEELNPVGRWLLDCGDGHVGYLLGVKFIGTVVAATMVLLIHQGYPRWSLTIAAGVAALQLTLLLFLLLA